MEDPSLYSVAKAEAKEFYASFRRIFSPALGQDIYFTSEGFNHLIFKRLRLERKRGAQLSRFAVLPIAVKLIGMATTYQEIERREKEHTVYWGIVAIINKQKIKVVVRKVGTHGNVHFWSVFPQWVTSKRRDTKFFQGN